MAKPIAKFSIAGLEEVEAEFHAMQLSIKPILRQAARKVGSKISRDAKAQVQPAHTKTYQHGGRVIRFKTTGTLRKAISYRATTSKKGIVHSIIGARTKTVGQIVKGGEPMIVKPYKYMHLVERGFMHQAWGRGKKRFITGKHFLESAAETNRDFVNHATEETLKDGLARAAAKKQALVDTL